ncbi:hypothetical protein OsJ_26369 [Oryza sativa Japonica Group]|uniref:Uncharacterized protein n=1 Tax=Oryza sativa subsp. japonica TaxID=39947 RepID=A3BQJ1_ORYSJ|nr:hypothetical protein OsJ_26369 [Oryza sativa Japonica Group]
MAMPLANRLRCKPNTNSSSPSRTLFGRRVTMISSSRWMCRGSAVSGSAIMSAAADVAAAVRREEDEEMRSYLSPEKLEVLTQMEPWVEEHVLPLLKPVEAAWQPSDLLPDPAVLGGEGFHAACAELRERAAGVPDLLLVCLVANMVTEEALPTYQSSLNRVRAVGDLTGADAKGFGPVGSAGWSAEGEPATATCSTGTCTSPAASTWPRWSAPCTASSAPAWPSTRRAARTTPSSTRRSRSAPRAVAHGNTARLVGARGHGDAALARVCGTVAADEKRHEAAYTRIVSRLLEADPDAGVRAVARMLRRGVAMPTSPISDGRRDDLYACVVSLAEQAGTYTVSDYCSIVEHLVREWRVEELAAGLSGEGRRARDYVCELPQKIRRMKEKAHERAVKAQKKPISIPINWIFDRHVSVMLP